MRGFRFLPPAAFLLAIGTAIPALAEIGITSVTSGDPLGQPPAQERRLRDCQFGAVRGGAEARAIGEAAVCGWAAAAGHVGSRP